MEYRCLCGTTSTLTEQEVLLPDFKCPNCGRVRQPLRKAHPRPILAGLLALLAPGLGHLYGGSLKLAISFLVAAIVLANIEMAMVVFWDAQPFNVVLPLLSSLVFLVVSIVSAVKVAKSYHALTNKPRRVTNLFVYAGLFVAIWIIATLTTPIFGSYETFVSSSASMENTIAIGDRILVDLSAYESAEPQRGELVVFYHPAVHTVTYVKRCVAVGSDVVEMREKQLLVNGERVPLPPAGLHSDTEMNPKRDDFGPYTIPANSYFMLGDSRDDSFDSRFFGPVTRDLIRGRAIRVWFNFKLGRIGLPLE